MEYTPVANRTANVAPIFHQNKVFYTRLRHRVRASGLKTGGGEVKAEEIYFSKEMQNHHGGVVLVGAHLYGFSNAILTCMDLRPVKSCERSERGQGSLTFADGHLYLFSENNVGTCGGHTRRLPGKGRFTVEDQGLPAGRIRLCAEESFTSGNQGMPPAMTSEILPIELIQYSTKPELPRRT